MHRTVVDILALNVNGAMCTDPGVASLPRSCLVITKLLAPVRAELALSAPLAATANDGGELTFFVFDCLTRHGPYGIPCVYFLQP